MISKIFIVTTKVLENDRRSLKLRSFPYTTCAWEHWGGQNQKFKRVSLNKTPKFPFWGLFDICVDFNVRIRNDETIYLIKIF